MSTPEAINLKNDVKSVVVTRSSKIRSIVVDELATREIERRTDLLHKALTKRDSLASELGKVKPKVTGFTETGAEIKQFSPADHAAKKKGTEKLGKFDKAIDAVIESPSAENYAKLKQVTEKS
jgi:uncharacterized iron-regulated protein